MTEIASTKLTFRDLPESIRNLLRRIEGPLDYALGVARAADNEVQEGDVLKARNAAEALALGVVTLERDLAIATRSADMGWTAHQDQMAGDAKTLAESVRAREALKGMLDAQAESIVGILDEKRRLLEKLEEWAPIVEAVGMARNINDVEFFALAIQRFDSLDRAMRPGCRRCSDCEDQPHHWIADSSEDGEAWFQCKHCAERAQACDECEDAVCPTTGQNVCSACTSERGGFQP